MAYWDLGFTKDDQRALAVEAERLGFDSLWIAEGYGSDAVSVLGWLTASTSRVGLGSAIMQIPGRPATMTAMSAATLDNLSDYVGGMGSRKKNFYADLMARYGFADQARHVQDLYLAGKKKEAEAALPPELLDLTSLCGPADVIRDRLTAYEKAGVDTLILIPVSRASSAPTNQVRQIAALGSHHLLQTESAS